MRKITHIVIHCAATKPTADIGVKEIDKWHRDLGWAGCGYHFVIRRNGQKEFGRPIEKAGAHVTGHNANTIGICLVGGVDSKGKAEDNFTIEQDEMLFKLVKELLISYPNAIVCGHRDFPNVKKDCPCRNIKKWMEERGLASN